LDTHGLDSIHHGVFHLCNNDKIYLFLQNPGVKGDKGLGGSMSWVVGLPNNSFKAITNTAAL
jgi:hypothetical protein